ncbi:TrmB family transcriptional regulator [Halococcoides cellulosivorans]|uniref:Transcriptional regulator n=1 Tax=Halococcoides cellulosivorans TaxID=1679096 RepID=A0A2R4X3J4_9EURY|nr:helix-turn-helix domain-containing protein [Halococcoides cellulosivorans]AWB28366.1 transcriptional regulator [Halococcoides cellulosivorans]
MDTSNQLNEAVDILQQLGLKEYEARCFVGLTRLETGTAKKLSEMTEVPRTRVYDAIRVLEAQGLVEIQHSSPQQFRAVPLDEATKTLQGQYEDRVERLEDALATIETIETADASTAQQVWAMSGREAIENRANDHIETATEEVVLVIGDDSLLTESLLTALTEMDPEVDLLIGTLSESLEDEIEAQVPNATTFTTGLEFLHPNTGPEEEEEEEVAIGRLLLIDRSTILVSSIIPSTGKEQAIFGEGFGNGLVVIARRIISQGLIPQRDPA